MLRDAKPENYSMVEGAKARIDILRKLADSFLKEADKLDRWLADAWRAEADRERGGKAYARNGRIPHQDKEEKLNK